ncbi:Xenotropic and polytropic retrovirus receptor 1 [Seminavis robusta]|uniref:Xenotropic and polytropic retrovirus receptor 1 n=1 Tax=Seminavis robusta TaxID=568900 RepID=A0A9N8DST4_9STRA|nr:Xenotropic and polytropic retrovirus receptor 1 [Seminavis robusta]|eukprot:Sro345_g122550.1 Xenotropic and polytropic retrovirus receptor 1 (828) ;mRNA; f:62130-64782
MDVSVVAAVGSFFMSERVLKPKATVLIILAMVLAYDLTTKTHDVSSLRVYRGPALVAFTLMMSALSLRTWRRNGVACDELLFLPGTAHGITHGVECPATSQSSPRESSNNTSGPLAEETAPLVPHSVVSPRNEADLAAGAPCPEAVELRRRSRSIEEGLVGDSANTSRSNSNMEGQPGKSSRRVVSFDEARINNPHHRSILGDVELTATTTQNRPLRAGSFDSSLGWGSDDSSQADDQSQGSDQLMGDSQAEDEGCLTNPRKLLCRSNGHGSSAEESQRLADGTAHDNNNTSGGNNSNNTSGLNSSINQFRENHPQITRMGSFFFFRSSASSTQNAVYAPSGPAVVGAALDLSMPVLFNFHLFIEAFNHIKPKDADSEAPAKILPIIFLSVLIVRSFVPPGRRGRFWSTLKFTVMSPFHPVSFRDAFIGDAITSLVRPGQDILFALSYYFTVIWGTVTGRYGLTESGRILEGSWVLHNVVLPSCALLPLWWKFLQTLRQAYDEGKRWPHLGNAFKHLLATLVILYGMTHPESKRSPFWIVLFLLALAYQIFWDVVMDWDLFEIPPHHFRSSLDAINVENWLTNISSIMPDSVVLMTLQMYVFTPVAEGWRRLKARLDSLQYIRLRSKRLYKTETFYWRIFAFNACMRFTWMLCFIPAYRLSSSGEEKVATFSSDVNSYVGVLLPIAEIVRRCFWGILLLERKTIQMTDEEDGYARLDTTDHAKSDEDADDRIGDSDEGGDDADDHVSGGDHSQAAKGSSMYLPLWLNAQQQTQHDSSNRITAYEKLRALISTHVHFELGDNFMNNLFLCELGMWAAAFVGLGCWAAS